MWAERHKLGEDVSKKEILRFFFCMKVGQTFAFSGALSPINIGRENSVEKLFLDCEQRVNCACTKCNK